MAKKTPARPKLRSMRSSETFRDFVLDQLSDLRGLRARAMFGGIGLYAGETFFGLIASDVLYLKTDDTNRAAYIAAGSDGFRPYPGKAMAMPYYNVPVDVLESAETLTRWAKDSIKDRGVDASTCAQTQMTLDEFTVMGQPVPRPTYASTVWTKRGAKWVAVFPQEVAAAPMMKK